MTMLALTTGWVCLLFIGAFIALALGKLFHVLYLRRITDWFLDRRDRIAASRLPFAHQSLAAVIMEKISDLSRMIIWLVIGLTLYFASYAVGPGLPTVQTVCYKLGHVTTLAWVGYWIARQVLGRVEQHSPAAEKTARAIIIGCVILAGSMGL